MSSRPSIASALQRRGSSATRTRAGIWAATGTATNSAATGPAIVVRCLILDSVARYDHGNQRSGQVKLQKALRGSMPARSVNADGAGSRQSDNDLWRRRDVQGPDRSQR